MSIAARSVLAVGMSIAALEPLSAHAFAERYDLPIPLWYYIAGAGGAVVLSFAVAGTFLRDAIRVDRRPEILLTNFSWWRAASHPVVISTIRFVSVSVLALSLASGFVGVRGEPIDNLLPVMVWVIWWVGMTYVAALAGNLWPTIDPVASIARWAGAAIPRGIGPLRWPDRLDAWPAVALMFVFVCAEMAWPENAVPPKLATAVLIYCGLTWLAMFAFGRDRWLERGDPFAHFFGLVGRFAPISEGGRLRPYGAGLVGSGSSSWAGTAFTLLILASVTFDGLRETPFWNDLSSGAMSLLYSSGLLAIIGNVWSTALVKVAGLTALPALFLAAYLLTCRAMAWSARRVADGDPGPPAAAVPDMFGPSLVPIAIAYHLAHYFSYLFIQGQAVIPLMSDPLGLGWNLFGTKDYVVDIGLIGTRTIWFVVVGAIVAGHVAAVFVAHITALRVFGNRRSAVASQLPMLLLMTAYTMLSLWMLSQPIVESS